MTICRSYRELASDKAAEETRPPAAAAAAAGDERREGMREAHPVAEAQRDMEALKQRLLDSELRAVEARQGAAAEKAAVQRGGSEAIGLAQEALQTLQATGAVSSGELHQLHSRLQAAQQLMQVPLLGPAAAAAAAPPPGASGGAAGPLGTTMQTLPPLDCGALQSTLLSGSSGPEAALVLQALRWRVTKPPRRQRKATLLQLIQGDLLSADVLATILAPEAGVAEREQALRLINVFASEPAGRSYLIAQTELVTRLCTLLALESEDSVSRQNCLGALQKLSLRRAPQNDMIDSGVIGWLAGALTDVSVTRAPFPPLSACLAHALPARPARPSPMTNATAL